MTSTGDRWKSTVRPPSTAWARKPRTSPSAGRVRSRRRGRRSQAPSTVASTASPTIALTTRLLNSTIGCSENSGVSDPGSHAGQVEQPSPEEVSRTAPPVTTIAVSATSATRVIRR